MASILIVDDEASMRFLLRTMFELAGHAVDEAPNGVAAIERIESGPSPDVVVTDLMMPVMDGGELIARIRGNPTSEAIPVILVSSSPAAEELTSVDAFFQKPFDPMAIVECAASLLASQA